MIISKDAEKTKNNKTAENARPKPYACRYCKKRFAAEKDRDMHEHAWHGKENEYCLI